MSNISAQMVKELRERSGAGMMECKKALVENNGDLDAAMEWLRKSGLAKADKKASRIAAEGRIVTDQASGKAVLVEINCETDFVGKDASFLKFSDAVAEVALKSGAADIDALKAAAYPGGGTVEDAAKALIATIGEKIEVRRMARVQQVEAAAGGHHDAAGGANPRDDSGVDRRARERRRVVLDLGDRAERVVRLNKIGHHVGVERLRNAERARLLRG